MWKGWAFQTGLRFFQIVGVLCLAPAYLTTTKGSEYPFKSATGRFLAYNTSNVSEVAEGRGTGRSTGETEAMRRLISAADSAEKPDKARKHMPVLMFLGRMAKTRRSGWG